MCQALMEIMEPIIQMREQENMEKWIEKGKIYGAISVCRDFAVPDTEIRKKLEEKFHLSSEEAEEYLQTEMP